MAAKVKITLDHDGIAEILQSADMAKMVREAANKIESNVRSTLPDKGAPTAVEAYTTDRAACSVQVNDVRALTWQAEVGLLTRAAAQIGADVRSTR